MKKNKFSNKNLENIDQELELISKFPDELLKDSSEKIRINMVQINKELKSSTYLILFLTFFLIGLIVGMFSLDSYNRKLIESNNLLNGASGDSLLSKILDIKESDSSFSYKYAVDSKGKIISYKEATFKMDSLASKNHELNDSLENSLFLLNFIQREYNITVRTEVKNDKIIYTAIKGKENSADKRKNK